MLIVVSAMHEEGEIGDIDRRRRRRRESLQGGGCKGGLGRQRG